MNKYRYAKTFRVSVVRPNWVLDAWERRNESDFSAIKIEFSKLYELQPFEGQKICFYGFANDEQQDMIDVLRTNGGTPAQLEDIDCSHIVSDLRLFRQLLYIYIAYICLFLVYRLFMIKVL